MIRRPAISRLPRVASGLLAASLLAGCAGGGGPSARSGAAARADLPEPVYTPAGTTQTVRVRAEVLPLGVVPYDNFSLPLVSPDGRFIATQAGVPPTLATALALLEAEVPEATRVEVHALSYERQPPKLHRTIGHGLLLGRSCDSRGFLVEAPQADGARWIGYVTWETGDLTWLVTGEDVNAFATAGPLGQLAWSRRTPDGTHFDLVVRTGTSEWTVASQGDDWLMPTWSGKGDGLFVLNLNEGDLDAVHVLASSPAAFRQSRQRLALTEGASFYSAFQTLNAQVNTSDAPPPRQERLVFFHPGRRRAAVWSPFSVDAVPVYEFEFNAPTAVVDDSPFALVSTPENLVRQSMERRRDRINLLAGMLVPRPTPQGTCPYLLVAPGDRTLGLTGLRLLPVDEAP